MYDGQSSDEVAENYRDSHEYLVTNDRYTINNLTVIAKENTEHAQAISKALEEHIRRVSRLHTHNRLPLSFPGHLCLQSIHSTDLHVYS